MITPAWCAWCGVQQRIVTDNSTHRCVECFMQNTVEGAGRGSFLKRAKLDPVFKAWVKTQRCRMHMQDPCVDGFGVDPHHAGKKPGMGMKADDGTCIPMCRKHHRAWHDLAPLFRRMSREQRDAWRERQIDFTQKGFADDWGAKAA